MLKFSTSTAAKQKDTASRCLLWLCVAFSYVYLLGTSVACSNVFTTQGKQPCELTSGYCCVSNSCVSILLQKGKAEKQLGEKIRRKCQKDGTNFASGSDAVLSCEHISIQLQAVKNDRGIFQNAVSLPCDAQFHIQVRAGPTV